MKELSIEEKAKRYDEAIKVAKDSFNYPDYPGFIRADVAFPELKESEDERMVKFIKNQLFNIKKTITENYELDAKLTNAIDWLEKQGEQPRKVSIWKHWKDGIAGNGEGKLIYLVKVGNTYRLTSCLGFECDYIELSELDKLMHEKQGETFTKKDVDDAYLKGVCDTKQELEKQDEQKHTNKVEPKFKVGNTIRHKGNHIENTITSIDDKKYHFPLGGWVEIKYQDEWELIEQKPIDKVEPKFKVGDEIKTDNGESLTITKIDEKGYWSEDLFICSFEDSAKWKLVGKPTDKVEPKFNVGDWIVFDNNVYYIGNIALKGYYECLRVDGTVHTFSLDIDSKSHLWTIQDAKPGDVLVCPKYANDTIPNIFIFKDIDRKNNDVYCYCSFLKTFTTEGYVASADPIDTDFCPATKEQRDQLEKAMTDAGYTFDFEKKELKKIEQKSVAKYKEWYDFIRWFVKQRTDDYTLIPSDDDIHKWGDNILNHAKKFLDKQNVAWSEEDEEIHRKCICAMRASACGFPEEEKFVEQVDNWLKSLKKRVLPQKQEWSEEDERMYRGLHNLIYSTPYCDSRKELSDFLDSLKNRVQQQSMQEWGEEDKKCTRLSTDIIDSALRAGFCVQIDRDRCVDWFKSLKERCTWKPSDEQMESLNRAQAELCSTEYNKPICDLIDTLNKLKG